MRTKQMTRVAFLQYGDFAETFHRRAEGLAETYRDQWRSDDFIADIAEHGHVTIYCLKGESAEHPLTDRLTVVHLPLAGTDDAGTVARILADRPDILICRTPHRPVLEAARKAGIPTLPIFADLFERGGLRSRLRHFRLARALSGPNVVCVGNHNLNASRSLVRAVGVAPDRVVPWDWSRLPLAETPKVPPSDGLSIFYAGNLSETKGVGDLLHALARLRASGVPATLALAGGGDTEFWKRLADNLRLEAEAVRFLGRISHREVAGHMRSCDVVVVPSRPAYPEGLPNTIYEALAARGPLVMSDHPAFAGRLEPDRQCLVFRAGDPADLAGALQRLATDPALFARLAGSAEAALDDLYFGTEWTELVSLYLSDPQNRTGWVTARSLARLKA